MIRVFELVLGRGYLLNAARVQGETVYWVENADFTSPPYHCLEDLVSFLHTLLLLPNSEDTLLWMNLLKALSPQVTDVIAE